MRLADLDPADVDMRCLLIVGSSQTQWYDDRVFTPRRYPDASDTVRQPSSIPRGPRRCNAEPGSAPRWGPMSADVDVTPIGTGQTGATYRVSGDVCGQPGPARHVRGQAVRPGRRRARAGRARLPVRGRVLRRRRRPHAHPDAAMLLLRHLRRRSGLRPPARRHGARGAGRPDRAAAARRKRASRCEALAGLHGPSWCDPEWMELAGIAMPKPGDDAAAGGLGEISQMAAQILVDKLGDDMSERTRRPSPPQCLWSPRG